jgi:hypothetical protein
MSNNPSALLTASAIGLIVSVTGPVNAAAIDHLDRVILLMAVNLSGTPAPLPGPDRSSLVIYGAVSAEAAIAAMDQLIKPLGEDKARAIRFAPVSYRYFLNAVSSQQQNQVAIKPMILPDPTQVQEAERLYKQQGIANAQASELARTQPTVFCPEPALYAQIDRGSGEAKRFIPCTFDFKTLSGLIPPGSKSQIIAIPWPSFAKLLADGRKAYLNDVEVLLSPTTQKAIQKTRADRQFLRKD